MKIETLEIGGFAACIKSVRLSYGKGERSEIDSFLAFDEGGVGYGSHIEVDYRDLMLLSNLVATGDDHAKPLRGIVVWARITAPVYLWAELETYRAGHERLMSESTMHIDCKGLTGEELQAAKRDIPMGKELTKVDFFSYQCLRNICRQRWNHRLPEWHGFIEWVKGLPFADDLVLRGIGDGGKS